MVFIGLLYNDRGCLAKDIGLLFSSHLNGDLRFVGIVCELFGLFTILVGVSVVPCRRRVGYPGSSTIVFFSTRVAIRP